jgi:hypothetical protein
MEWAYMPLLVGEATEAVQPKGEVKQQK